MEALQRIRRWSAFLQVRDGTDYPYPNTNPLPEIITDVQVPPVDEKAEGEGNN